MKFIKNNKKAFTLIELLVVVAIISLLSAIVLNSLASARMKANDTKIAQDLRQFRIAAELYYNDNHEYPPTAMNSQDSKLAVAQESNSTWSKKLSFFIKTAEAASGHPLTPLCSNFDTVAGKLVTKRYLSTIPVHPYDNDANHVCYKAVNATTTFSAYASLTTQVSVGSGSSAGTINKRTGFILGDTSSVGVSNLVAATESYYSTNDPSETAYPVGLDGSAASDLASSLDAISGITNGSSVGDSNGYIESSTTGVYVLNVITTGPGSVSVSPLKSKYDSGETVTLTANPNNNSILFGSWNGCTTFNGNVCNIVIGESDATVNASFAQGYLLTATVAGGLATGFTFTPSGPYYLPGQYVTVKVIPRTGYRPVRGYINGIQDATCFNSSAYCYVTMGTSSKEVSAFLGLSL